MGCAWLIERVRIGQLDLLTLYTHNFGLQAIQHYRWCTHFTVHLYTRTTVLSLHKSYPGNGFITVSLSLQITHEVLFAPLNPFLSIILQLPIPKIRLNSIPLLPSSYLARLASRNSTQFLSTELFFISTSHGPRRKQTLYCFEGLFSTPLHSNGSYSIVACVFVAAEMCLPSIA
jgi:hypothetical protein